MVWVGPCFVEIAYGVAPVVEAFALAAARCSDHHCAAMQLADPEHQSNQKYNGLGWAVCC